MDPCVGRIILRVVSVEGNGRVLLQSRAQKRIRDHVENCAPCHNPNIDLWQNPQLAKQDLGHACHVCRKTSIKAGCLGMLLCHRCNEGWHMNCLNPVVRKILRGDWFCLRCAPRPEIDFVP
jgi:hypothetical protein